ncbi:MAG: phosphate/phosphite/phosphonate ABC transporter substrate-binding protein [Candidatus Cloacimonadota bacterium]|nr:phosphate/phosphite/phosphonate ABC transporter substrate-binding protein [Candidatus Cloacimonadota bacterium]
MKKVLTILLLLLIILGCSNKENKKKIDMGDVIKTDKTTSDEKDKIRIAVAAMISPKETFVYYEKLLDYIGEKIGQEVEFVQRDTYGEVNQLLENKKIDFAFVCSGPYVTGKEKFGMQLLVVPVVNGETVYYSYVIVSKDADYKNFADLKQTNFAFTDPKSNTGCLVPTYELSKLGQYPETFFRSIIYTHSHDNSIEMVARKKVDAATVDHLIWEYMNATNPKFTSQTKIIRKFGPFGIPPVVVHPDIDKKLKNKVEKILLNMHKTEEGKKILNKIMIEKFAIVDDEHYESVRQMKKWLNEFQEKEK